ncbi:MAG TPA: DUF3224 domain-containing protein [Gemmatimonadales bacterium]|jgi:hypothetical protein
MTTHAKAIFEIKSWDEKPWLQLDGKSKLTLAAVTKVYRGDITGEATSESLMYYLPDGSAVFNGFERIAGTIGGREGSFVLQASGVYRDGTATCECTVVPGSGTGQLTGLHGEAHYAATHTDYPNVPLTMDYRFDGGA